jgi:hypothetical protein
LFASFLEGEFALFDYVSALLQVLCAAAEVAGFELLFCFLFGQFGCFEPVLLHPLETGIDALLIMHIVLTRLEHLPVLLQLVHGLLNFFIILRLLLQSLQRPQRVGVGLVQVSAFVVSVCEFSVQFETRLSVLDFGLVVGDAAIVFVSQSEHVSVVFDLLVDAGAVAVVLHDCAVVGGEGVGVGAEEGEDGAVLEGDGADGGLQVDGCDLEDVERVDEHFLLLLECVGGQCVPVDLHVSVVVGHFLLCVCA